MTEKSSVWKYFVMDSGNVSCTVCQKCISQGSDAAKKKNTSNLWSHLKIHHARVFENIRNEKIMPKNIPSNRPTVKRDFFGIAKIWPDSDLRAKKFDSLISEMLATDNLPFNAVENPGFQRLLAAAEPRYRLKTEKFYRTQGLQDLYGKVELKIRSLLASNESSKLSFTTDCWSGTTESLMSLTAHFVDAKWERKQVILNVKAMEGSHTGEYIAEIFDSMLEQWNINKDRVFMVLRDSGSNMVKGLNLAKVSHISCFAHSLQLVVTDAIKSQTIQNLLRKFRNIATHFRHSVLAKQRLSVIQDSLNVAQHTILQSVPTRWNSNVLMLERMLEQKRSLCLYASEHGHVSVPTSEEWKVAEKLMDLLKPIQGITQDISHAGASLSLIIPSVNVLAVFLQSQQVEAPDIETVRTTMLSSLTSRFSDTISCKYAVVACVLDPRFKDRFLDSVSKCRSKQWLKEEIGECSVVSSPQSEISTPDEEVAVESQQSSTFEKIFDTLLARADTNHSTETTEIEKYLCEPLIDRKDDSLKWWRMNYERFPNLALVAQRYFSVPPTTVPSERLFSTVGLIYEEHRSSLLGENAEKLCFLNYNLRLLDWKY